MNPIHVIIAEDHPIFRDGLTARFADNKEIVIVAQAENGAQLIEKVEQHNPDVVLLDLEMPVMDGRTSMQHIKATHPHIKFIVLSMSQGDKIILDLVEKGCNAYLSKNVDYSELQKTIKLVVDHGHYYTGEIYRMIQQRLHAKRDEKPSEFSNSEKKIIGLIAKGHSSAEIAQTINLSERTVENYRSKILHKMKVRNVVGMLQYAQEHSLLEATRNK